MSCVMKRFRSQDRLQQGSSSIGKLAGTVGLPIVGRVIAFRIAPSENRASRASGQGGAGGARKDTAESRDRAGHQLRDTHRRDALVQALVTGGLGRAPGRWVFRGGRGLGEVRLRFETSRMALNG